MCGIAGIVGTERDDVIDAADIHRMCQTIVHRGPDDEGIYVQGSAGLGMRRLSIIDLSRGHQPIHNEDRTIWVVFNGEIYNFLELRSELEGRGHHFYTNTDTEVIVHLFEEYGSACVPRLRGMFALALWDERNRRLLLARDRFGKKPLHYAMSGKRLLFGSEIKAILATAPELTATDRQGLLSSFYFGYIPDPLTVFAGIRKVPPGHLLEMAGGQLHIEEYWDLPSSGAYEPSSEEECLDELEERLTEAVRIRMISDVPLGALLSGGVDSSTVVALMARLSSSQVKTFSIAFSKEDYNEGPYAKVVAQQFGTQHHELLVEPDIETTVQLVTRHLEEPFADSSVIPTYHVCRLARQHVTVTLAGDGGDELFGGYDRYEKYLRRRKVWSVPPRLGLYYRKFLHPRLPAGLRGRRTLYNVSLPPRERYLDEIGILPACGRDRSLFSKDFLTWADKEPSPYEAFLHHMEHCCASDPLSEALYLDAKTYLSGDILTKVDRMSMANSLEVRAPFLDNVLAEWAAQLSPSWKIRSGQTKYIVKKLAERLGVPKQVLYRRKQGFSLPLVHWFRQRPSPALLDVLLEPRTLQRGYFDEQSVRRRIFEHRRGMRDCSWEIWHLLIFELWHRNFLEPATQAKSLDSLGWAGPENPKMVHARYIEPAPTQVQ